MNPYRTLLFVPGNREQMLAKAPSRGADAILADLEDGVPVDQKQTARELLATWLPEQTSSDLLVRVNAVETGETLADLEATVGPTLKGILLPKAGSVEEVEQVAAWLDALEVSAAVPKGQTEIVVMIESTLAVVRSYELASAPRVASLCFGSAENGDLQTDLGCDWSAGGSELLYARSKVVLDSRAAGIEYPLDGVFSDLDDLDGLVTDTIASKRLGYRGRTVIHPKQIGPVNEIYTPSAGEVAYYRRLLAAFEAAVEDGKATASFEGKMIDYAMAARARSVLALAETIASSGRRSR